MAAIRSDRTLYLDETRTRVLEYNDPNRRHLLIPRGHYIDADTVERLGLYVKDGRVQQRAKKAASQAAGPSYKELQDEARALGLKATGKREELEARIAEAKRSLETDREDVTL